MMSEERGGPEMELQKFAVIDRDGDNTGTLFDTKDEAVTSARNLGPDYAVEMLTYSYDDSELVWTPDGSDSWVKWNVPT